MKKGLFFSFVIILSFMTFAFSSGTGGGSLSDPLVTQKNVTTIIDNSLTDIVDNSFAQITPSTELVVASIISDEISSNNYNINYIKNDSFSISTGDKFVLLNGSVSVSGSGSLINITSGEAMNSNYTLSANQQYVVAENSSFTIAVTSNTAKISTSSNSYAPKYEAYADQLFILNLFKGSDKGYELTRSATRIEALVMLIRLLGEEEEALKSTASHPFTDIASWSEPYVAYAYDKGYTVGVTETLFLPNKVVRDLDYYTFLLRILNYKDNIDFTWSEADIKALQIGIIDKDFYAESQVTFYRDQLTYASFNLLQIKLKDSDTTLAGNLIDNGFLNQADYNNALKILGYL